MKRLLFVLSMYHKDVDKAVELTKWMIELGTKTQDRALVVTTVKASSLSATAQVIENLGQIFEGGVTHYPLAAEEERGPWYSNNFMFRSVAQYVQHAIKDIDGFYFFEPDCLPVSKDWWERIRNEYDACGMPFMGDVRGVTHDLNSPLHMNGSGIYPQNVAKYSVKALCAESQPWDAVARDEIVPNAHPTKLIRTYFNTWNYRRIDDRIVTRLGRNGVADQGDDTPVDMRAAVIHGCKDDSLLNLLRESRAGIEQAKVKKATLPPSTRNQLSAKVKNHDGEQATGKLKAKKSALTVTDFSPKEKKSVDGLVKTLAIFCRNDATRAYVRDRLHQSRVLQGAE